MPARKTRPGNPPPPAAPPHPRPPADPAAPAAAPGRHAAGIDAGDRTHWACVGHTPDGAEAVREFPAHTPGLRASVGWLAACAVTTVALEATGAYARVLFVALREAGLEVVLAPPHFARQVRGRPKTDRLDCRWIRRRHHYRPEHLTELRLCRRLWDAYQAAVADLDGVIADRLRSMRRQTPLPPLPPQPRVRGRKPHDPAFDVRGALYLATGVDRTAVEGIDAVHALTPAGELGRDFSKWPTVEHFTSWLGRCPNWRKTGGEVQASTTRRGTNRAAGALRLAAWALVRSRSYPGAYLRRQRAPKAVTATAHKLARVVYHPVRYGAAYVRKTEGGYAAQDRARVEKQFHRRAKGLGYEVRKVEPAAPAGATG